MDKQTPTPDMVKAIFKDTYNFYLRWKDISALEDWVNLIQDMRQIDAKYGCDLCRQILLELVKVIEDGFLKKQGGN